MIKYSCLRCETTVRAVSNPSFSIATRLPHCKGEARGDADAQKEHSRSSDTLDSSSSENEEEKNASRKYDISFLELS
ncbi:unnamed protein product, partial [Brenthis ino]